MSFVLWLALVSTGCLVNVEAETIDENLILTPAETPVIDNSITEAPRSAHRKKKSQFSEVDALFRYINQTNEEFMRNSANGIMDYNSYLDTLRHAFIEYKKANMVETTTEHNFVSYGW
ncbi:uncharacterized protein LOC126551567 [Aphis gossypii]|uniref:Uncharacterized protein n=1 Tax=Aphis gossypii TaxID=80765 RepID=A0A9P0N927_APHGO|nr:uncharacterized protein LOC126551567 [Aphis gossypii]CAH1710562.1 unnamed protein product [Aphis gossypii]